MSKDDYWMDNIHKQSIMNKFRAGNQQPPNRKRSPRETFSTGAFSSKPIMPTGDELESSTQLFALSPERVQNRVASRSHHFLPQLDPKQYYNKNESLAPVDSNIGMPIVSPKPVPAEPQPKQQAPAPPAPALTIEEIENLAFYDMRTGTLNLRYIAHRLAYELERSAYTQRPLAVMVIAIDQWKRVHNLGSEATEMVLVEVSGRLMDSRRTIDMIGSFVEGRFIAVCPDIEIEQISQLAEYFQMQLSQLEVKHGGHPIPITASIGISTYSEDFSDVESIIALADMAADVVSEKGGNGFGYGEV